MCLKLFDLLDPQNCQHDYVVLRRWEAFTNFNELDDIDILCRNPQAFASAVSAQKRNWGRSSYKVTIEDREVPLDLRSISDEYIPSAISRQVLTQRRKKSNFHVPSPEDFKFLFLLHLYLHKKRISAKDFLKIQQDYGISNIIEIREYLSLQFKKENINIYKPLDRDVYVNEKHFKNLAMSNTKPYPSIIFMLRVKIRKYLDDKPFEK